MNPTPEERAALVMNVLHKIPAGESVNWHGPLVDAISTEIRAAVNAALEEAAQAVESLKDSSHDESDLAAGHHRRWRAMHEAAETVRALKSNPKENPA